MDAALQKPISDVEKTKKRSEQRQATDEEITIKLKRGGASEKWGLRIQEDTHELHGHQVIWVAHVKSSGAAVNAVPRIEVGDIIEKMDGVYTDDLDYTLHLQSQNEIELTIVRQKKKLEEGQTFTDLFNQLFGVGSQVKPLETSETTSSPTKDTTDNAHPETKPLQTIRTYGDGVTLAKSYSNGNLKASVYSCVTPERNDANKEIEVLITNGLSALTPDIRTDVIGKSATQVERELFENNSKLLELIDSRIEHMMNVIDARSPRFATGVMNTQTTPRIDPLSNPSTPVLTPNKSTHVHND